MSKKSTKPKQLTKKLYQYSSNNSGGNWWLTDQNWYDLEKAGWKVLWIKDDEFYQKYDSDRWLGALAKKAQKEFENLKDAIKEFQEITGLNLTDEGCSCCGYPHTFYWGRAISDKFKDEEYGCASGPELSIYD